MNNIISEMNNKLMLSSSYYYFSKARFFAGLFRRCPKAILSDI